MRILAIYDHHAAIERKPRPCRRARPAPWLRRCGAHAPPRSGAGLNMSLAPSDLRRMDQHSAFETERGCALGRGAEAVSIIEVAVRAIERAQTVGAACSHDPRLCRMPWIRPENRRAGRCHPLRRARPFNRDSERRCGAARAGRRRKISGAEAQWARDAGWTARSPRTLAQPEPRIPIMASKADALWRVRARARSASPARRARRRRRRPRSWG